MMIPRNWQIFLRIYLLTDDLDGLHRYGMTLNVMKEMMAAIIL